MVITLSSPLPEIICVVVTICVVYMAVRWYYDVPDQIPWHKICYNENDVRLVRKFVIRKRIGDEVRFLQICCWEERYRKHSHSEASWKEFTPTKFVTEYEFDTKSGGKEYADYWHRKITPT